MNTLFSLSKRILVLMIVGFFVGISSVPGNAEDICAEPDTLGSASIDPLKSTVYGVVMYVSFPNADSTVSSSVLTQVETTFPAFINEMSYGAQTIHLTREVPYPQDSTIAWVADSLVSDYHDGTAKHLPMNYPGVFEEIIERVYLADTTAFEGKDFVALVALGNPWWGGGQAFRTSLTFPGSSAYWDSTGFAVDLGNLGASSTVIAMTSAHEYGHLVGLSDKSGGWGRRTGVYDLMYNRGFGNNFKLKPFCSNDLSNLGWIEQDNIQTVMSNTTGITLKDIRNTPSAGQKVLCKILLPATRDTLLVENHQDTGQDTVYNGKGLLIWHSMFTVYLDVEVAKGTPGTNPNADWLDSLAAGSSGDDSHLKESRKDDFFGWNSSFSSGETSFTPTTEPNTNTWHNRWYGDSTATQGSRTTVSILDIRAGTGTDVVFDVTFDYTLPSDETWPGNADDVYISGDVTVPNGRTLTIQSGTTVKSSTTDASSGGWDSNRCELIVQGKLIAEGTSSNRITFQSPSGGILKDRWYGIVFRSNADDASVMKYADIKNARYAVYCDSTSPDIEHNTITHSTIGVKGVNMLSGGSISYNTINNTTTAVSLSSHSTVPVQHNDLSSNVRSGYFTETTSTVQYDTLDNNDNSGIALFSDSDIIFGHNRIVGNGLWGMWLWSGSDPVMRGSAGYNNINNNGNAEIYCQSTSEPRLGDESASLPGHNAIYDDTGYAIQTGTFIKAERNWWGSTDSLTIRSYMSPPDSVDFSPWDDSSYAKPAALVDSDPVLQDLHVGITAEEFGEYRRAIAAYQKVLQAPDNPWTRDALGGLHRSYFALREDLGEFRGLMKQVAGETKDGGIKAKAEELARKALVAEGQYDQAIAEYQAVVDAGGEDALAARVRIGEISLYRVKEVATAKTILSEVIAEAPESPEAFAAQMALDDANAMPGLEPLAPQPRVVEKASHPEAVVLAPSYPNPFNPQTTLSLGLPGVMWVRLVVYDILGQEVRVLVDEVRSPGTHRVVWDGRDGQGMAVGSGLYFARLEAEGTVRSRKLLLIR